MVSVTTNGSLRALKSSRNGVNSRSFPVWNSSRNGGTVCGFCGGCAGIITKTPISPSALLHLHVDRGEMLMVALRVQGIDAQQVDAAFADGERDARPNAGPGFQVDLELALRDGALLQVRQRLLAGAVGTHQEVANGHVLQLAVRIRVGEDELHHQRLV